MARLVKAAVCVASACVVAAMICPRGADAESEGLPSGHLVLRTTPWSTAYVDGCEIGTTPQIAYVSVGRHSVAFRTESAVGDVQWFGPRIVRVGDAYFTHFDLDLPSRDRLDGPPPAPTGPKAEQRCAFMRDGPVSRPRGSCRPGR